ncbi:MAG: CHAT domain-containing protein [Nitrospirota bacterium]|jgi:hypothetical protein
MDTSRSSQPAQARAGLVLEAARDGDFITVGTYPLESGPPLRGYDRLHVDWSAVEERCQELNAILGQVSAGNRPTLQGTTTLRRVGHTLFDQLITAHAKKTLRTVPPDILHLAIDEHLAFVPWEMLHDGTLFWAQRYALGRMVRTQREVDFPVDRPPLSPRHLLIVADPQGNLAGAHAEGCRLRSFLSARLPRTAIQLITSRVTAPQVRDRLRECDVLHYAGHARYDRERPGQSGWRLHGGDLTPSDLLPMAGGGRLPSLIFANACSSGRGVGPPLEVTRADDASPLANAFLLAGVRHYLGTSWEIPDEASATFASAFYDRLLDGAPIGVAVRSARLACLAAYGEGSVIWASYLLYGDPTVRYFPSEASVESVAAPSAVESNAEAAVTAGPVATRSTTRPATPTGNRLAAVSGVLLVLIALVVYATHWEGRRSARLDNVIPTPLLRGISAEAGEDWQTAATAYADGLRQAPDDPYLHAFASSLQSGERQREGLDRSQRIAALIDRIAAYTADHPETTQDATRDWPSQPMTLAVLGVDAHQAPSLPAAVGIDVARRLSRSWEQEPRLSLVDRQHLDRVLEELHLAAAKLARPDGAIPLGALAPAQLLAVGEIIELGDRLQLSVRLIETATSTVVAASSQVFATLSQVDAIVTKAAAELTAAVGRHYPIHAEVIDSHGDDLILNVGAQLGVAPGNLFRTVGVNDAPVTVMQVERVEAHRAQARPLEGLPLRTIPLGSHVEQVWNEEG